MSRLSLLRWAAATVGCLCATATLAQATVPDSAASPAGDPAATPGSAEATAADAAVVPVSFRGKVLFTINSPLADLSQAERAAAIAQRLLAIAGGPAEALDTLRVVEHDGNSGIYVGDTLVRVVTDQDAKGSGRTRRQLAADQALVVRTALATEFRDRSAANLLRAAILAVVATIVMLLLFILLRRAYGWTRERITRAAQTWHWESGLARLRLLSPEAVASASRTVAATIAWVAVILVVYFYLEFVLSLFPWTRGIAKLMVSTSRASVVHVFTALFAYLPKLLNIVVIVVVARVLLKVLRAVFRQIATERISIARFYPEWAMPTYSLVRFLVLALSAVMIFPYLPGSGSEGFRGVSVFVGLLVSLGAASAIANVIAGLVITYMRPFRTGDRVKIADAVGDVTGKDLFVVRLRTIKNVDITIPNSLVLANHIVNFSSSARHRGLILHTSVTIGYDVPWQRVHELLVAAAGRVDGIKAEPKPYVLQTSLDDFYVSYELNAYTERPNEMAVIYSALHAAIQDAFSAGGVEIMSPHYSAIRDGNRSAIPDEHLPRDYRAPAFNVLSRVLRPEAES